MSDNREYSKFLPFKINKYFSIFIVLLFILIIFFLYLFSAPLNNINNKDTIIHVTSFDTIHSISSDLKDRKIIRSESFLKLFFYVFNNNQKLNKGDYLFQKNLPIFSIAWQLAKGKHNVEKIKVTLREGLTNQQMSIIFSEKLAYFNVDNFMDESDGRQGYLFPDTYFFFPMDNEKEVIEQLNNNFLKQTTVLNNNMKNSKYRLDEIITMASIIEKEAKGEEDAYLISGILWKRLEIGMPLQVDAYRPTYEKKGLPDKPICNPGLISIKASLTPTESPYLYYLHDKNGNIYYAKSYTEHQNNINKYLR